jgi:catechol 2,3-dioxygenase-like lactoylglutathione lyase family enzyme
MTIDDAPRPVQRRPFESAVVRRPSKLAHVVLRTKHFEESIAWYQAVLGAFVVFQNDKLAFLTYDDEHHRLALVPLPEHAPERPAGSPGLEHIGFTFASMGDLLATYRRLADQGITPVWAVNHGPTTSVYYRDPDDNEIELQVDNFDDLGELIQWFATGAFAVNPIGPVVDPEELIARWEAGEDECDIARPFGLEEMPPPQLDLLPEHVVKALR